jgi:hypothetical protein
MKGNGPVRSLYRAQVCLSAKATKQKILVSVESSLLSIKFAFDGHKDSTLKLSVKKISKLGAPVGKSGAAL